MVHYILEKPSVSVICPSSITLNEGDDFTCVCGSESGNPPGNVTWFKDDALINETATENQMLTLSNVDGTASGYYTCLTLDRKFKDRKTIEMRVNCKYDYYAGADFQIRRNCIILLNTKTF